MLKLKDADPKKQEKVAEEKNLKNAKIDGLLLEVDAAKTIADIRAVLKKVVKQLAK